MKLNANTLASLPQSVSVPPYDRNSLKAGIIHIGVGNYHRAHQSWYMDRLFSQGRNLDWAIIGAGVRPADAIMREKLAAQDWMTTLIETGPDAIRAQVVGPMVDFLAVTQGHGPLIAAMSDPAIRIVTLTVTEGGYYIDPATQGFDATHPEMCHDAVQPERPCTAFGAIVAALGERRAKGFRPFTVQSCDNLPGNGDVVRSTVVSLARMSDPDLADWIDAEGAFPNSMVDGIVPGTGPREIALCQSLGIEDAAPVTHEPWRQWVIEDKFCDGRPDWEAAGVIFSDHVHDFERMKIRILNGGHAALCYPAALLGLDIVWEAMADPRIRAFFRKLEETEMLPHVKAVPGFTPAEYLELIDGRFSNRAITDTTRRLAFDGANRQPKFILPAVWDGLAMDAPVEGLALVSAAWCRYCCGSRDDGRAIEPNDPIWPELQRRALQAKEDPALWLEMSQVYGDLGKQPRFAAAFAGWLKMLHGEGTEATLARYCG